MPSVKSAPLCLWVKASECRQIPCHSFFFNPVVIHSFWMSGCTMQLTYITLMMSANAGSSAVQSGYTVDAFRCILLLLLNVLLMCIIQHELPWCASVGWCKNIKVGPSKADGWRTMPSAPYLPHWSKTNCRFTKHKLFMVFLMCILFWKSALSFNFWNMF